MKVNHQEGKLIVASVGSLLIDDYEAFMPRLGGDSSISTGL